MLLPSVAERTHYIQMDLLKIDPAQDYHIRNGHSWGRLFYDLGLGSNTQSNELVFAHRDFDVIRALDIGEVHFEDRICQLLNNGPCLPGGQPGLGAVFEKGDDIEKLEGAFHR